MDDAVWLFSAVENAQRRAKNLREWLAAEKIDREENSRLDVDDKNVLFSFLEQAEGILADQIQAINSLADDIEKYAKAKVDRPDQMTLENFIHPPNIAPRLRHRVEEGGETIECAYYFYWPVHFYETKLRICLTLSDQEEPLFVTAKDLSSDSLYRMATCDIEDLKTRLLRNISRHTYLNELYA